MSKQIYLDHAAATPMDRRVVEAMQPYFTDLFYNPSAQYLAARDVAQALANARARVAHWLGARPSEIIFTSGGTEANNLAIHGVLSQYPNGNILVSSIEHDSVLQPARKYPYREAAVTSDGTIDIDGLLQQVDEHTVLASVMYANNEIGTIQPIKRLADGLQAIRDSRKKTGNTMPLLLHTDACQAANYLDLHVSRLGVDLMTINAGKIYGPKQSGVLFVRTGLKLEPQLLGGGQEFGQRSGTEGMANIIGLAAALDLAQGMRNDEVKRLQGLQKFFIDLITHHLPNVTINGSLKHRLPNNLHITIAGADNERLIFGLDEHGILCAAGSACSASKEEPSHVLKSLGLSDETARSSLRFSLGRQTDEAAIKQAVEVLAQLI